MHRNLTIFAALVFTLPSCVDGGADGEGEGEGDPCANLCTGAGFDDGALVPFDGFPGGECTCEGSGDGIADDDCAGYCDAEFDIAADKSFVSDAAGTDDKCVCDGSGG